LNKSDAPDGHENWFVMVNMPCDQKQDWEKISQITRSSILARLSSELDVNVEDLIVG
jgi:hypothetical protein